MSNHFVRAIPDFAHHNVKRAATWAVFARDTISGFLTTAHHTLMILGITAIAALGVMFVRPDIADQLKAISPFTEAIAEEQSQAALPSQVVLLEEPVKPQALPASALPSHPVSESKKNNAIPRQQQWITAWLSKRYRVASDATNMLVSAAYLTAQETKLDPLLILAVMAIESGFNPFAESPVGAQGLMQVMSKVHHDKFAEMGGVKAALNPVANIRVGSLILKDYVTRGGSIEAGLKLYVGAAAFESDSGYGARVLAEYHRLKDVSKGKKVPVFRTAAKTSPEKLQLSDRKPGAPGENEAAMRNTDKSDKLAGSDAERLAAL